MVLDDQNYKRVIAALRKEGKTEYPKSEDGEAAEKFSFFLVIISFKCLWRKKSPEILHPPVLFGLAFAERE